MQTGVDRVFDNIHYRMHWTNVRFAAFTHELQSGEAKRFRPCVKVKVHHAVEHTCVFFSSAPHFNSSVCIRIYVCVRYESVHVCGCGNVR